MLLLHQTGSVKIGEVVRYTVTYAPSNDRILPTPSHLHLKIKNASAIPLRAAYLHGPYTLHVSAYPASFNPHQKVENPQRDGVPEFEPLLKAGGSWTSKLIVPEDIRETGADLGKRRHSTQSRQSVDGERRASVTWIIEVASQILFSNSASVSFEVLVGRDERSLELGFAAVAGHGHGMPGQVEDSYEHVEPGQKRTNKERRRSHQTAGVYSKAIRLQVEDTEALWDKPAMPTWEEKRADGNTRKRKRRKKVHLVIVTHGLHSNIGADMLFLKESIDATVAEAKKERKRTRTESTQKEDLSSKSEQVDGSHEGASQGQQSNSKNTSTAPLSGGQEDLDPDDEEETIVRGFNGNAVRTENGIQYLGKRLAKYILKLTYPDQPFLPIKRSLTKQLTSSFHSSDRKRNVEAEGIPSHPGSSIHHPEGHDAEKLPYKFTSISFIGHSLGGLIQTYAIAYIHKHSPGFFQQIEPINFICLASPMLGLSNENPMYVRFALDFGLVGRTGQDLGLTWRPPTMVRGGWNAMIGGLGGQKEEQKKHEGADPGAKPLLRILPTGPAHQVLRKFRNRTVYSNVVNDGIVPLRTSCLLFLDWRGLGKVEKARRENGLIGTMVEWGWAEMTGTNESERSNGKAPVQARADFGGVAPNGTDSDDEHVRAGEGETVPQPNEDETARDNTREARSISFEGREGFGSVGSAGSADSSMRKAPTQDKSMFDSFLDFFRPATPERTKTPPRTSKKTKKAITRAQTVRTSEDEMPEDIARGRSGTMSNPTMRPHMPHMHTGQVGTHKRPAATRGDSLVENSDGEMQAPPRTNIFESAADILHPPIPSKEWLTDPSSRARTIFHDRVYHPEDIPPPPAKRPSLLKSISFNSSEPAPPKPSHNTQSTLQPQDSASTTASESGMKVEEKIARAYHKDLSWRKVLVRLEPDAHNNMIVRRMFANAYGWPVVKHVCDTHFGDSYTATTRDEDELARERAEPMDLPVGKNGEMVEGQTATQAPTARTESEVREARDELTSLAAVHEGAGSIGSSKGKSISRQSSTNWDDSFFSSDADDSEVDERGFMQRMLNPMPRDPESPTELKAPEPSYQRPESSKSSKSNGAPPSPITSMDYHRGLGPTSPTSPKTPPKTVKSTFEADATSPVIAQKLVEEPEPLLSRSEGTGSSAANLGLGKSVEEQVSPGKGKSGSGGGTDA